MRLHPSIIPNILWNLNKHFCWQLVPRCYATAFIQSLHCGFAVLVYLTLTPVMDIIQPFRHSVHDLCPLLSLPSINPNTTFLISGHRISEQVGQWTYTEGEGSGKGACPSPVMGARKIFENIGAIWCIFDDQCNRKCTTRCLIEISVDRFRSSKVARKIDAFPCHF